MGEKESIPLNILQIPIFQQSFKLFIKTLIFLYIKINKSQLYSNKKYNCKVKNRNWKQKKYKSDPNKLKGHHLDTTAGKICDIHKFPDFYKLIHCFVYFHKIQHFTFLLWYQEFKIYKVIFVPFFLFSFKGIIFLISWFQTFVYS